MVVAAVQLCAGCLLTVCLAGQVVPSGPTLLPVGLTCSRVYWSTINPRRRTVYTVRTVSAGPPAVSERHCLVDHSQGRPQVSGGAAGREVPQQLEEWRLCVSLYAVD